MVDVPDGTYRVEVLLGDMGKTKHDPMGLSLEGTPVDPVTTAARQLVWQTYTVQVGDGQLTAELDDLGGRDKSVAIAGLTVTAVEPDQSWPTVTVEPVAGLPSGMAGPVQFQVTFSEPVAGFTADDVRIDCTGPGTVSATVAGRGFGLSADRQRDGRQRHARRLGGRRRGGGSGGRVELRLVGRHGRLPLREAVRLWSSH